MMLKQRQQTYLQQTTTYQYACKLHIKEGKIELVAI